MIAELSKRVPCDTIRMENDAKAAALGEMAAGGARDLSNFIFLGVGTGIGGGLILNRKLYNLLISKSKKMEISIY